MRMASTAVSKVAWAVMTTTLAPGCRRRISGSTFSPDSSESHRSRKTTSKALRSRALRAPAEVPTPRTRAWSASRHSRIDWRMPGSSSTISADQFLSMRHLHKKRLLAHALLPAHGRHPRFDADAPPYLLHAAVVAPEGEDVRDHLHPVLLLGAHAGHPPEGHAGG